MSCRGEKSAETQALPDPADGVIRVRGARVHNLQNIDIDIPRDRLVVITGPSGSGKSSLALDTLYAEGQRQYIESLSVYARQFLHQLERPDVDLIDGLPPTICINQGSRSQHPRSTVATVTEIYDYLRLLFARLGQAHCHKCGLPISQQTTEQIQDTLLQLPEGTKAMIMAPLVRGRKGRHADALAKVRKAGLVRVRVDGVVCELEDVPELSGRKRHHVDAVVDRIIIREGVRSRIGESIEMAVRQSEGMVTVCYLDTDNTHDGSAEGTWRDRVFSTLYACPDCNLSFEELEPRTFSFNSPYGICPACEGMGARVEFDPDLVLPDRSKSLEEGAVAPWKGAKSAADRKHRSQLADFLAAARFDWQTPLDSRSPETLEQLIYGDDKDFLGVLMLLEKEFATTTSKSRQEHLATFRAEVTCPACDGSRLRPEATSVYVGGKAIHQVTAMPVGAARGFFESLSFDASESQISEPLVSEIIKRLEFLEKVGVTYLTLDRPADTLSGGELQRVRLATGIGSGLVGICYILDEPSIGLHPRDNQRLIESLRELNLQGNTVLVVEHDEGMMRAADHLIDIGPEAGEQGGRIVAEGTPQAVSDDPNSITGRYLSGRQVIPLPRQRRRVAKSRSITIEGAATHNLQDMTARIPLGALVCVTGVSGSGKSSLINETLAPALVRRLQGTGPKPGPHKSLRGSSQIDKVIAIDQAPIGRTPRSNPATYTGMFDEIRRVFANTRQAKQLGYGVGRFSFNVSGGRCEECQGQGVQKIEMNFLPDIYVPCKTCNGARFNRQTLEVRYRGKNIGQVLDMSIGEAAGFFENFPQIRRVLESLVDVGLGYLQLGQPSTTVSGGEAQRIKLATQLARVETGKTLYLLDEPTTGLHFDDIRRLLDILGRLVDKGNTVLVIEHHLDVIKSADWIIDLGPEGGEAGGHVVATGRPEEVAEVETSYTGRFLKPLLNGGT
jgi:excinuclease ABC subunit A